MKISCHINQLIYETNDAPVGDLAEGVGALFLVKGSER